MFSDLEMLKTFSAMAEHAAKRHEVLSRNIANADTPGYKAEDIQSFADAYQSAQSMKTQMDVSALKTFKADIPGAESPNGNNVSIEDQMLKTAENKGQHDMALAVYKKTLDLMKLSLGRGR